MTLSLPAFSHARVLVAGDVMLDRYWHGSTTRISPEAPVPVVHVREVEERPGGAANVAVNVAALGARPMLLGLTGDDDGARGLERLLAAHRVEHSLQRLPGFATVTKMRVLSRHQQLIRLDFEDGFRGAGGTRLLAEFETRLEAADAVVLSDYGKGTLEGAGQLIDAARRRRVPVLVDPKGSDYRRYRGATVITPNLAEFEAAAGPCRDLGELSARGEAMIRELELQALLVTRGDRGMSLLRAGRPRLDLAARAREVYDVTGAGDTVIAVLAAALAAGSEPPEAVALANLAAGIVVGKLGTAGASARELERALHEHAPESRGLLTEEAAAAAVRAAQARGERVVLTNGCFDLLHAGHVGYLARARALGERLVVALNDDASVQRLKGRGRPVNTLARRSAVIAALECVDWVVSFAEDTPERLIGVLGPDVLVKGGDYRVEDVAGADLVRARGGRVEVLGFEEGCSTSAIIEGITRAAAHGRGESGPR